MDQMNLKLSLLSSSHRKASEDVVSLKVNYSNEPSGWRRREPFAAFLPRMAAETLYL